ncbi:hypothetical protein BV22DRAFT_305911 [Leucogyrophana mollusca]|uniref:Uncharacterized protein n=1 Tax=Leucogyrophana mollusca TaxID=85980 RepID=A0ACB8BMC7_9AGAM|nr:hypothetical protein BV22DRAFT_305911 [Leucogyrophana mollusca]
MVSPSTWSALPDRIACSWEQNLYQPSLCSLVFFTNVLKSAIRSPFSKPFNIFILISEPRAIKVCLLSFVLAVPITACIARVAGRRNSSPFPFVPQMQQPPTNTDTVESEATLIVHSGTTALSPFQCTEWRGRFINDAL